MRLSVLIAHGFSKYIFIKIENFVGGRCGVESSFFPIPTQSF